MPSQKDLVLSYYRNNPGRDIEHPEVVDWATNEWQRLTGRVFRDPDRAIRKLCEEHCLQKVSRGIYRYVQG